jgi:hypothetical protein
MSTLEDTWPEDEAYAFASDIRVYTRWNRARVYTT